MDTIKVNYHAIFLSLYISFFTVIIILIVSFPIAYILNTKSNNIFAKIIDFILFLPLILPPTVLGFYIMILFSVDSIMNFLWFFFFKENFLFSIKGMIVNLFFSSPKRS